MNGTKEKTCLVFRFICLLISYGLARTYEIELAYLCVSFRT